MHVFGDLSEHGTPAVVWMGGDTIEVRAGHITRVESCVNALPDARHHAIGDVIGTTGEGVVKGDGFLVVRVCYAGLFQGIRVFGVTVCGGLETERDDDVPDADPVAIFGARLP